MNEPTTVPAKECVFQAAVEVRERKSDSDKSTPFSAIARTGDALSHAYWGRVVHDLDGMRVKSRIPIDWNHTDTLVGYANRFDTESGDLEIKGALTPTEFDQTQRAQQIIDQAEQGVPFEMSISFPGDLTLEKVPEGSDVTVNNRTFSGPLTVIRSWPLRSVAITPMGQDPQTALQFSEDQHVTVTYLTGEDKDMSQEELTAVEVEAELSADTVDASANDTVEAEVEVKPEAVDAEQADDSPKEWRDMSEATAKDFQEQFGKIQGSVYFADGLSMVDALRADNKRLQEQVAELTAKKADEDGEEDATQFSQGGNLETNVLTEMPAPRAKQILE